MASRATQGGEREATALMARAHVEPGGAVGLAALLAGLVPEPFRTVAVIPCGANVDAARNAGWIADGAGREG